MTDFEKYRRPDRSLDLKAIFHDSPEREWMEIDQINRGIDYLADVMARFPVVSRQAAAIAITTAISLAASAEDRQ